MLTIELVARNLENYKVSRTIARLVVCMYSYLVCGLFSREISQATSSLTFSTRNSILETRDSILETRDLILETIKGRVSSLEGRVSRLEGQLTFERYCSVSKMLIDENFFLFLVARFTDAM